MRVRPHHHPCQHCGVLTPCSGDLEGNYDGWPSVVCTEFHVAYGDINADFLCEDCGLARRRRENAETLSRHLNETLMQNTVPATGVSR